MSLLQKEFVRAAECEFCVCSGEFVVYDVRLLTTNYPEKRRRQISTVCLVFVFL